MAALEPAAGPIACFSKLHFARCGPDTAGLAMLEVVAQRIHWWSGEDNGEIVLDRANNKQLRG